jgi:transposase
MAAPTRHVTLTPEQDQTLRTLEHAPNIHAKVRLRASIIRLNAAGWSVPSISDHHQRNPQSVHNDLDRFEQHGVHGLTDGKSTGKPGKFTPSIEAFLHTLLEQDRAWNTAQLSAEITQEFKVKLEREAIRVKLVELGYAWKRARYAPGKAPDASTVMEFAADLNTLKKGRWTRN